MKFRKMLSGLLACALAVTSVFAGNVSTVKAAEPAAVDSAAARTGELQVGKYYIVNTAQGGFLNGGNAWGTQASALPYGELMEVANEGGKTYIKYGSKYLFLTDEGYPYMDGASNKKLPLSIEPCQDGSYTIAKEDKSVYLTASAENTVVTFAAQGESSKWRFLTRDEFIAEATAVSSDDGADVTSLITDSNFTREHPNYSQWNATKIEGADNFGKVGKNENKCHEGYNNKFSLAQTIENIPNGIYELNVQGAHQQASGSPVYYINGTEHQLKLMSDEDNPPGNADGFSDAFSEGRYFNTPIRAVVTNNKLTIGIKMDQLGDWVIWDGFTLKYKPASNAAYQESLDKLSKPSILGTNQGYQRIRSNLALPTDGSTMIDGMGLNIAWTSSNPAAIGNDGTIQAAAQNGDTAVMTAKVTVGGEGITASKEWTYPIRIAKSVALGESGVFTYDFNDGLNGAAVLDGAINQLKDYEGEVTYAAGRSSAAGDKAVSMDGSYGLELPHYNLGDTWTVSMWYCPQADTDILGNSQLLFVGYGMPSNEKWVGVAGENKDTYKIWSHNVKGEEFPTYEEKITPQKGKWNMLTVTQGADKKLSIYENGALLGQSKDCTEAVLSGDNQTIYLGTNYWDAGFKGLIDDVTVSNKALTEQEVGEAYLKSVAAEDLKAQIKAGLEKRMLGENESLQKVTKELTLPAAYLGKTVTWQNSNDKALTIEGTKAAVAAKGKLPESTTLTYTLAGVANGTGIIDVQAGTEEAFDRQEFFSKEEAEQKDYVKAEIEKEFLNGNRSEKQVVSDLKLLQKVSYKQAVIAGVAWSSSDEAKINTTETPGTGKVKYDKNLSERVTLTATVSPDDGAPDVTKQYAIPFKVKVVKPAAAAPTDMGNSANSAENRRDKTSATMDISSATGSITADGSATNAPGISGVSMEKNSDGGGVGSDRIGYLVFDLASLLKGSGQTIDWNAFDPETIEYAYLKLHINNLHQNLGSGKMKIGLYPVQADKIAGISNADPSTYPAAQNTDDENENAYDKDHVIWCEEWLVKTDMNKVVTFDVKKLVLAAAEKKQDKIAFRVQVPFNMVYVAGLGDASAANHPSLSVQLRKIYTDAEKIEEDIEELSAGIVPDKLSEDSVLTLPAEIGEFKSQITWISDNNAVKLEKDEANKIYKVTVTRPTDRDADVSLTAKLTNGTAQSEPMTFTTKVDKYMTNADLQGKLIAGFTFDDALTGVKGNGAGAEVKGTGFNYNADGKFGKAITLGANTWLEVTKEDKSALLKGKEEITVSYYSKSNFEQTSHGSWTFFAARDGSGVGNNSQRHYLALLDAKNAMKAERYDGNNGHYLDKTGLQNEWRKVDLVVYKDKTILYIDGVKVDEKSDSTQALTRILGTGGGVLYIGKGTWGSGEYFDGLLDEYKIYDRALTADEVSRMYQQDDVVEDAYEKLAEAAKALEQPEIDTENGVDTVTFVDTVSQENCSIRWTIPEMEGKIEVLEAGKKIKLIRGNSAAAFKVTATITYQKDDVERFVTKEFEIEIPKIGDKTSTEIAREDVSAAKTELQANGLTIGTNDKITLPQVDSADKCTITWTAPEGSAIEVSKDGKTATVTRGDNEAQVTLTAQIRHKTQTSIKDNAEITITVPALTPQQKAERDVAAAKEALEAPVINADDTITFKTEDTEHNCTIAWSAPANSAVKISEDGKTATVTRGTRNQNVRLTATITSKSITTVSDTKSLTVTIPKELPAEIKALLEEAIADTKEDVKDAYTEESYQKYSEAYEALKALSLKEDLTAADIEAAAAAVKTAAEGLVVLDEYKPSETQKKALGTAVTDAAALQDKDYVQDDSWKAFQAALKKAQAISNRSNATKDQVEKAVNDLNAAKAKLTLISRVDKTELKRAIAEANKLKQKEYTAATWKKFQAALNTAKTIDSKSDATQAEVNNAVKELKAKQKELKKLVTKLTVTDKATGSKAPQIAAGKKLTLKVTAAPAGASSSATYAIAKKQQKYAKVSSKGVVTTKKAGAGKTVTVTVTAKDGSKKKTTIKIKIMKNAVTKITLKAAKKVKAGKSITIKANVKANGKKANKKVIWSVDKKGAKYASINSKGKLTTKKTGKGKKVTVTATSTDGTNKKAKVTITLTK